MSGCLLDVNVLIALIDPTHVHHDRAHEWFAEVGRDDWLSSPTTQNGAIRVVSNPKYSNAQPTPESAILSLRSLTAVGSHRFVPDDISLLDAATVDAAALITSSEVTDTYLLALARHNDSRLATFDRRMATSAVTGGEGLALMVP